MPRLLRLLLSVLLTCTIVVPLSAFVEPEGSEIRDKAFRHSDLNIRNGFQPMTQAGSAGANQGLAALGVDRAYLDVRSGRWGTLTMSQPLLPGDGQGNQLSWEQFDLERSPNSNELKRLAWDAFTGFLSQHRNQLGIDVAELQRPGVVTVHRGGDLVQIYAPRVVGGVEVRDTYITASISHGNLVLMGATNWGDLTVSSTPTLSQEAATAVVNAHLGDLAAQTTLRKSALAFVPLAKGSDLADVETGRGYGFSLAWVTVAKVDGDIGNWESMVDAHSGELLKFEDLNQYASTRQVIGGVLPIANDGVPPDGIEQDGWPMPFADVTNDGETAFTDAGGNLLACVDGEVTSTLSGQFMQMSDQCGEISLTTAGDVLDFGSSAGTDCATPGFGGPGNTHASRSGFYEMNRIKEMARAQLPDNDWLKQQLNANMNIPQTCNATWDGTNVNFFRSGGGCSNTGEIAAVYDHEWGHGMDNNDALPAISNPGEGIPDIYAALRLSTSCIGRSFLGGNCTGYGDPCTDCSGVRDIDWANRASGIPHDLGSPFPTGIDALCGAGGGTPCGGSSHCEGAAYTEAVWDLINRDLTAAPFNMSVNTARELVTQLTFLGGGAVGNWFQCSPPFGGCNADGGYLNYLAADDDDGNLANGTPHMSAIFAAFDRHQIACDTPAVADSGCAGTPTAAPDVTATPRDRGADVSWDPVAGAVSYNVYRTDGIRSCDYGKQLVASTTGTSIVDSGLQNGREYYYIVIPLGPGDTCFGPASDCTPVTPATGANLAIDPLQSGGITFVSGDGDPFLDNCEEASVKVTLANIGSITLTNVQITDVRSGSFPIQVSVTSTLPLDISPSLATCDVAMADISFIAGGLSIGDVLELEIDFTSDELAPLVKTQTVRVGAAGIEGDVQSFASKTFSYETDFENWQVAQGIFNRTDTGGGDGTTWFLDSSEQGGFQCNRVRSPKIGLAADSTMELWNNWDIEPQSGGTWYDRANVGLIDTAGERTLVTPDGGRPYNADSSGPGNYGGCNEPEEGWADVNDTWGTSSWSAGALQSGTFAGEFVQLEVIYATDALLEGRGFWFDEVTLTNIDLQVNDTQDDKCPAFTIFADGFESGDTTAWSVTSP